MVEGKHLLAGPNTDFQATTVKRKIRQPHYGHGMTLRQFSYARRRVHLWSDRLFGSQAENTAIKRTYSLLFTRQHRMARFPVALSIRLHDLNLLFV